MLHLKLININNCSCSPKVSGLQSLLRFSLWGLATPFSLCQYEFLEPKLTICWSAKHVAIGKDAAWCTCLNISFIYNKATSVSKCFQKYCKTYIMFNQCGTDQRHRPLESLHVLQVSVLVCWLVWSVSPVTLHQMLVRRDINNHRWSCNIRWPAGTAGRMCHWDPFSRIMFFKDGQESSD